MKQSISLVVAAMLGSFITLGTYHYLDLAKTETPTQKIDEPTPSILAHNNKNATTFSNLNYANRSVPADFTEAAAKVTPAVVHIKSTQRAVQRRTRTLSPFDPFGFFDDDFFGGSSQPHESSGSGVIVSAGGYIVTNNHVIEGAEKIDVTLHDKRNYEAEIIGTDPSTDLALLKITDEGLPTLELANSDDVQVGEWVLAVGNPFNLASTVTAGIVSAKGRNLDILKDRKAIESFIQTDAAVNPGNSGGALVNTNGQLIGINTAIATPTGAFAGYSFAVPANIVEKIVADLLEYGMVQRAYLGVQFTDLDGNLARKLNIDVNQGIYVEKVLKGSSADEAGLQDGDVIMEMNGKKVSSAPEFQEILVQARPGDQLTTLVRRNGKEKRLVITLKNKSGNTDIVTLSETNAFILENLGASFEELSEEEKQAWQLSYGIKVVELDRKGKLAKSTDIQETFIIKKVNGTPINTVDDFVKILDEQKGQGILLEGVYPNYKSTYFYGFGL